VKLLPLTLAACCLFTLGPAQPRELRLLGQSPGGSAFNLTYDSISRRLFVGCGTSIWVLDVSDVTHPVRTAMRPFRGMVNEMILDGGVLFAATTHDGLWALDAASPSLDVLAHLPTPGDSAAYDPWLYGDTLYLANGFQALVLTYEPGAGFAEHARFGTPSVMTVARRGNALATGSWRGLSGTVSVYQAGNLASPVATWSSGTVYNLQDIQFADRRDDILYLCGGTNNLGFSGQFYALRFAADTLYPVGHFTIGGIPGLANAQIINLASCNDTLFLVTTAGLRNAETDLPVIDATPLPNDTMLVIGHIRPGLWYFDADIINRNANRYLAIASEWYGVWINDVTSLQPLDTVAVYPTGGWSHRNYIRNDTLWGYMNGYGLVAGNRDSLLFPPRFLSGFELLRISGGFPLDFTFVDDSLVCIASGFGTGKYDLWNLGPWRRGGAPAQVASFGSSVMAAGQCVAMMQTNRGPRLAAGTFNTTGVAGTIELYDPYERPAPQVISSTATGGEPEELIARAETLWSGAGDDTAPSIACFRVVDDTLRPVASARAPGVVTHVAKDCSFLAAACGDSGFAWYAQSGDTITELGRAKIGASVADIELQDSLLYAATQFDGLRVYNIAQPESARLVATGAGSGGWEGMFGSTSVALGPDGGVYVSDFNAGTFIYEPVVTALQDRATLYVSRPTPDCTIVRRTLLLPSSSVRRGTSNVLLDATGRKVLDLHEGANDVSRLSPGVYFVRPAYGVMCNASNVYKVVVTR